MQIRPFSEQLESAGQDLIILLQDTSPGMVRSWRGASMTLLSLKGEIERLEKGIIESLHRPMPDMRADDMSKYFKTESPE